jgi:ribosomal 30S subunit maturation factor RimM
MCTIKGKLIVINETQQVSEKFSKRTAVIETSDQYPQKIEIQFSQDKTSLLDQFFGEENVEASINLRGREWTNDKGEVKYFNTIECWKIDLIQ